MPQNAEPIQDNPHDPVQPGVAVATVSAGTRQTPAARLRTAIAILDTERQRRAADTLAEPAAAARVVRALAPSAENTFCDVVIDARAALQSPAAQAQRAGPPAPPLTRFRLWSAVWSLALRGDFRSDRLGLFWWAVEPLLHVLLITIASLLFHGNDVYNMPTFPFAVLGVVGWLTFRSTFNLAASGTAVLVHLLDQPGVSRFDIIVARATKGLMVNAVVGGALMIACVHFDLAGLPRDPVMLGAGMICLALTGFGLGLGAHLLSHIYSGFRKIYVMLLRLISTTSGLFFVSEQLPDTGFGMLLWNPILHGNQLIRQSWFDTYRSTDLSLPYFFGFTAATLAFGLACAIRERRYRAEHGEIA